MTACQPGATRNTGNGSALENRLNHRARKASGHRRVAEGLIVSDMKGALPVSLAAAGLLGLTGRLVGRSIEKVKCPKCNEEFTLD